MKKNFKKPLGFTVVDVTVAVIIVSLFAALTLPRLPAMLENAKVSAAKKVLLEIYRAQKVYFLNNNQYATQLSNLDVQSLKYPQNWNLSVPGTTTELAKLTNSNYSLTISTTGQISCSSNNNTGCARITSALGSTTGGRTQNVVTSYNPPATTVTPTTPTPPTTTPAPTTTTPPTTVPPDDTQMTADEFVNLYSSDPQKAVDWINKNPDAWKKLIEENPELLEKFPELRNVLEGGTTPLTDEELKAAGDLLDSLYSEDLEKAIEWVLNNLYTWEELVERNPDLLERYPELAALFKKETPTDRKDDPKATVDPRYLGPPATVQPEETPSPTELPYATEAPADDGVDPGDDAKAAPGAEGTIN